MDKTQRRRASEHQLGVFAAGYEPTWRLTKLLSIKMVLEQRTNLAGRLHEYDGDCLTCDDSYVYGTVTNGLIFSAVSEFLMYCEDLFALLKYLRDGEYFVQHMVTYSAGTVTNLVERLESLDEAMVCRAFFIPEEAYVQRIITASSHEASDKHTPIAVYKDGLRRLCSLLRDVTAAFREYEFFHNQYKHGFKIALSPWGNQLPDDTIDERKNSTTGLPICYDNASVETAFAVGRLERSALIIPALDPAIQPFLNALAKERNLLRYHMVDEVDIATMVELARKTAVLIICLLNNRVDLIDPRSPGSNTFNLPNDDNTNPLLTVEYCVVPDGPPLTLADFAMKI